MLLFNARIFRMKLGIIILHLHEYRRKNPSEQREIFEMCACVSSTVTHDNEPSSEQTGKQNVLGALSVGCNLVSVDHCEGSNYYCEGE